MWWRRILAVFLWLIALVIFAYALLPWRPFLAKQIVAQIEKQGITPAALEVEDITLRGVRLRNLSLGKPPLTLSRAEVGYDWRGLLAGKGANEAKLHGLNLSLTQMPDGWKIDGLPMMLGGATKSESQPEIPVARAALPVLPLASVSLENSRLIVRANGWSVDAPLSLMLQQNPAVNMVLKTEKPTLKFGDKTIPLDGFEVSLALDESAQQWNGKWSLAGLNYPLAGLAIMPLFGEGDVTLMKDNVRVSGGLFGAEGAKAKFALEYALAKPETSTLTVTDASLPYMKGTLGIPSMKLMLDAPMVIEAEAILENLIPNPANSTEVLSAIVALDAKQSADAKSWAGTWRLREANYGIEAIPLPTLAGSGDMAFDATALKAHGTIANKEKTYRAGFDVQLGLKPDATSTLKISDASMPWGGGNVAARNVRVPLNGKSDITLNLDVRQVEIDTLLQSLTGNKATATGVVSGSFPLIITATGDVKVGKGTLKAEQPGVIALSPEVIPGDNAQVALARDVLKNLHYSLLSLELGMEEDGGLSVRLAVDGSNPDVENGRPIKLKVNLSGDVLDLIQQNVKLMSDPETFIKQNTHEKN